jgi:hypothetical protein
LGTLAKICWPNIIGTDRLKGVQQARVSMSKFGAMLKPHKGRKLKDGRRMISVYASNLLREETKELKFKVLVRGRRTRRDDGFLFEA